MRLRGVAHHSLPPGAGLSRRPPVDPAQPGGELEVRGQQHRPEDRLQVQRRGHDHAHGPEQRPVPGPGGRRRVQAAGRPAPCCMVRSLHSPGALLRRYIHNLPVDLVPLYLSVSTLVGMPSSRESSGRFPISRRNLKTEVCTRQ